MFLVGIVQPWSTLGSRTTLMVTMYLLFAFIYYKKHRNKHVDHTFKSRMLGEKFLNENNRFLLFLAFGMSLFFLVMHLFSLERFMWAGFACSSLLAGNHQQLKERSIARLLGAISGSVLFLVVMRYLPSDYWLFVGPAAGFFLGFSTNYRNQTMINCFGALLLAQGIYGLEPAVSLRVLLNMFGILFGVTYLLGMKKIFQYINIKKFEQVN